MTWVLIISGILRVFGPLLAEWIQNWLDGHLKRSAAALEADGVEPSRDALFEHAIASLPVFAVGKRELLNHMWKSSDHEAVKKIAEQL